MNNSVGFGMTLRRWLALTLILTLAACGGGGSDDDAGDVGTDTVSDAGESAGDGGSADTDGGDGGTGSEPSDEPSPSDTPMAALQMTQLELAQTHVLPPEGKQWTIRNTSAEVVSEEALHLTGGRSALAMLALSAADVVSPKLEGWRADSRLGEVSLLPPSQFPPTEADGPAYATNLYTAMIPDSWMQAGLELRAVASNYTPSARQSITVGGAYPFDLRVLPFYLFGANDSNSAPLSESGEPNAEVRAELFAKWPVSELRAKNHPAKRVDLSYLVVGPRTDGDDKPQPAYVAHSADDYKDGYAALGTVLGMIRSLRYANGESELPVMYYTPVIALDDTGKFSGTGGGVGGGSGGTGDHYYAGVFIHEIGHAFGLPHVGGAYDDFEYPYKWGSLDGSAWGYDVNKHEMLAPFMPTTSEDYPGCEGYEFGGYPRPLDSEGRCIKQDPMQSGSGDQAEGYKFATFSDYSTAVMQRYFEGRTELDDDGKHEYDGGSLVQDSSFPSGYKRWDTIDRQWVNADTETESYGLFGFNQGLPLKRDVPVYAIVVTMSYAGTPGVTQIYPPLSFTGNISQTIDPTDADDRASLGSGGDYRWFCEYYGCDYTLRVTYTNGQVRHVLLQGGFRSWFGNDEPVLESAKDPLSGDSYQSWSVNVPNDGTILRIEFLDTPMAWQGMPLVPKVLASR